MANRDIPVPSQLRGGANFTAAQIANLTMYDAVKAAINNEKDALRRKYEPKIAKIKAKIAKLREEHELKIADLMKNKYAPLGNYAPLLEHEMNRLCWVEYTRRLSDAGQTEPRITDGGLREAHNVFHEIVRRRHMLDFLSRDNNREILIASVKKIVAEEPEGKGVKRLCELLENVGVEMGSAAEAAGNKGKRAAPIEESGGTRHSRRKK